MEIKHFLICREYGIPCKLFLPWGREVAHITIGVHGFAGDKESSMLEKLAHRCTAEGGALLCFDFPAHGASPVQADMLTVENCKQDLLAVASYAQQHYPHAPKSIFATSFGGYISLLCCHQLPQYRIFLRAPAVTMPSILLDNVLKTTDEAFRSAGVIRCGFERPIELPYSFYCQLREEADLLTKPCPNPIAIVHGDRDDIVPPSVILTFVRNHPQAKLHIIENADHRFKKPGQIEKITQLAGDFLFS